MQFIIIICVHNTPRSQHKCVQDCTAMQNVTTKHASPLTYELSGLYVMWRRASAFYVCVLKLYTSHYNNNNVLQLHYFHMTASRKHELHHARACTFKTLLLLGNTAHTWKEANMTTTTRVLEVLQRRYTSTLSLFVLTTPNAEQ